MSVGDAFKKHDVGEKVGSDAGGRVGMMWAKVEEARSRGGDGVTVGEVDSFHGGEIAPDDILLCV